MRDDPVVIGIAQAGVLRETGHLVSYALGSCVGICLYDRGRCVAGMVHVMLPGEEAAIDRKNPFKFADSGCRELVRLMVERGAERRHITAKIAGGACMFQGERSLGAIGERNVQAVRETLRQLHIPILGADTGKDHGRTIDLDAATGILTVKTVRLGTLTL